MTRPDEVAAVARLRKTTIVVFAVNRAASDRPKAARAAAEAALRVKEAQIGMVAAPTQRGNRCLDQAVPSRRKRID